MTIKLPENFKMCDVPEEMLIEDDKAYVMARLKEKFSKIIGNTSKVKRYDPIVFDDIPEHKKLKKSLEFKNKRWNKKRKHVKDGIRHYGKGKTPYGKWRHHIRGFRLVPRGSFKHLRAQKVYTVDEYDDTDCSFWFDEEFECNNFEDQYLYAGDVFWENYVDKTGRVLDWFEMIMLIES